MRAWGNLTDLVLAALREHGPMTRIEIERELGIENENHIGQIVGRICKPVVRGPEVGKKRAHICGWTRHDDEGKRYTRPIYKAGHGKNSPKPPPLDMNQVKREYWKRRRDRLMQASVFRLGENVSTVMRADWREAA